MLSIGMDPFEAFQQRFLQSSSPPPAAARYREYKQALIVIGHDLNYKTVLSFLEDKAILPHDATANTKLINQRVLQQQAKRKCSAAIEDLIAGSLEDGYHVIVDLKACRCVDWDALSLQSYSSLQVVLFQSTTEHDPLPATVMPSTSQLPLTALSIKLQVEGSGQLIIRHPWHMTWESLQSILTQCGSAGDEGVTSTAAKDACTTGTELRVEDTTGSIQWQQEDNDTLSTAASMDGLGTTALYCGDQYDGGDGDGGSDTFSISSSANSSSEGKKELLPAGRFINPRLVQSMQLPQFARDWGLDHHSDLRITYPQARRASLKGDAHYSRGYLSKKKYHTASAIDDIKASILLGEYCKHCRLDKIQFRHPGCRFYHRTPQEQGEA